MAYIRDRRELLTGCQDRSPWSPETDLQYDFIMVYGVDEEMPKRIREYREKGYVVHLMTGSAWGEYQDYLSGEWDGVEHWDESQADRRGNPILHGVNVPYMCPTKAFSAYLTEKLKPAVDAGAEAIHFEEPEFWDDGGYSEAFKREYQVYYKETWQPPHASVEARYKSSALKVYLYKRLVSDVSRDVKLYAKSKEKEIAFYVPTHSLVNYTQWKILSPEGLLIDIPTVDGCIAQVWTGTSRVGNVYKRNYNERTFETAFLEYGVMQELVRATGRRMWFLHDPIEDNPEYTWENFEKNYLKTVAASLMHPMVKRFEVSPWPTRVFKGVYPKKMIIEDGIRAGRTLEGAKPIPRAYANRLSAIFQMLGDMDSDDAAFETNDPGFAVFMADSGLYERTYPDSVLHSEGGVKGMNEKFISIIQKKRAGMDAGQEEEALFSKIENDEAHFNDYVTSGPFPQFFSMAMPLLKAGIPVRPIQFENLSRYNAYLDEYKCILLSYEWMKPQGPKDHEKIHEWVKKGGILVYTGDGSDPYHAISAWWNEDKYHFSDPAEHLFEILNVPFENGTYKVGEGKVVIFRQSPAILSLSEKGTDEWLGAIMRETVPQYACKNHFIMKRGPYRIIACMEECPSNEPVTIYGKFIDMLSDDFAFIREKTIQPGEVAIVYDLDSLKNKQAILATTARIESMTNAENVCEIVLKAALNIDVMMRLKLDAKEKNVYVRDEMGEIKGVESAFDEKSGTLFIKFKSTNQKTYVSIRE
ncbi:MAG: hypothetical protein IKJ65_03635 [Clostridia bacterium]|nr:hypothetical protein [Clostridia bacterium]